MIAAFGQAVGPCFENGVDVPADFFEHFGIAEGRVAVADQDQILSMQQQHRTKAKLRPELFQGGRVGDDFQVTCGNQRHCRVGLVQNFHIRTGFAEASDIDAHMSMAEEFIVEDAINIPGQISRQAFGGGEGQQQDHDNGRSSFHP